MALETGNYINDLSATNPTSGDKKSEGDDHIRLIKTVLKNCLPGFTGTVIAGGLSGGVANAYTLAAAMPAYVYNSIVIWAPSVSNNGSATININGLGVKNILSMSGAVLATGDLIANQHIGMVYNGTEFRLLAITKSYVDQASLTAMLPNQPGNGGKVLTTDGTNATWTAALALTSLALTNALPIASGGTGATTPDLALSALGGAKSGANSDITSLTGLVTPLGTGYGGTGATTPALALAALGGAKSGANSDITSLSGLTTPLSSYALKGVNSDITSLSGLTTPLSSYALKGVNSDITSLTALDTSVLNIGSGQIYKDANGMVGVGTSSPNAKLNVIGSVLASQTFGNNYAAGLQTTTPGGANSLNSGILFRATFAITTTDYTPRRTADIWSGFNGAAWGTEYLAFGIGGSSDGGAQTTECMRICANGNVGIGTNSPSVRLEVNGAIKCTTPASTSNDTTVATTAFFYNQFDSSMVINGWHKIPDKNQPGAYRLRVWGQTANFSAEGGQVITLPVSIPNKVLSAGAIILVPSTPNINYDQGVQIYGITPGSPASTIGIYLQTYSLSLTWPVSVLYWIEGY